MDCKNYLISILISLIIVIGVFNIMIFSDFGKKELIRIGVDQKLEGKSGFYYDNIINF